MAQPKAVREAAEKSRQLAEQIVASNNEQQAGDISQYLDEPPASKKAEEQQSESEHGTSQTATPTDPHEGSTPPKPDAQQGNDLAKQLERANSAFSVLKGKYDAEVPRLSRQVRELTQERDQLKGQIHQLEQSQAAGDSDTGGPSKDQLREIRAKLQDEYPEDLVDGIFQIVKAAVGEAPPARKTEPEPTPNPGAQTKTDSNPDNQAAKTRLLARLVPDWQEIDNSVGWQQWCQLNDPMSGQRRQELLMDAFHTGDIERVATFFEAFKTDAGITQRKPSLDEPPIEPESRSSKPPKAETPDKRVWKLSEVRDIEARARRGEFAKHQDKLAQLRSDIQKAGAEGRIDQSK